MTQVSTENTYVILSKYPAILRSGGENPVQSQPHGRAKAILICQRREHIRQQSEGPCIFDIRYQSRRHSRAKEVFIIVERASVRGLRSIELVEKRQILQTRLRLRQLLL